MILTYKFLLRIIVKFYYKSKKIKITFIVNCKKIIFLYTQKINI